MPLNLMILTSYFAIEPKSIRGGIGYRYVGLYGSLVKALLKNSPKSKVFWYSHTDQSLRIIGQTDCKRTKTAMIKAIINAISDTLRNRRVLAVIIAYPYAVPRINRIPEYLLSLLMLKIFSIKHIKVIVDEFDLPVEAAYAFSEVQPSTRARAAITYQRTLEIVTLKLASFIVTISEFLRQYMARRYHIREEKTFVVSNGSLVRLIRRNAKEFTKLPLKVLYAGSAMKVKDIEKLVSTVAKLREKGLYIDLYIAGAKLMDMPSWVFVAQHDWPNFVDDVLLEADLCVIPYPPNRLTFFHAVPAKLFDYMAAGKPIISTNLNEVRDIIKRFNCGLVARDWNEFELHLKRLHRDREFAKKLGENGRRAAEKYFNYELLAEALFEKLVKMLRSEN